MSDNPIKISITGKVSYADEISVTQAAQIITYLNSGTESASLGSPVIPTSTATPSNPSAAGSQVGSPRDALDITAAKTNPEKIVALAAYVLQDGGENFTIDTIKPLFRRARETAPQNMTRDMDVAIRSGWIGDGEVKGEYFLTAKAAKVLDTGFESIRPKRSTAPRAQSKRLGVTAKPESFADIDVFPTSVEGTPTYHKVSGQKHKLLLALAIAKSLGFKGLNNKEIVWLTDHLGEGIAVNNVNTYYKLLQKDGYANKSTVDLVIRITPNGEEYLKTLNATAA
jgi:hypothetical protein